MRRLILPVCCCFFLAALPGGCARDAGGGSDSPDAADFAPDASRVDSGSGDAGRTDAGRPDAGRPDGGGGGGPDASISTGAPERLLLIGQVVTPDVTYAGQVLVEGSVITCAAPDAACATRPGASGATIIDTHGIISPGLIDTHNHILFDIFDNDDWLPAKVYTNHNDWPDEERYHAMLNVKHCLADDSQGKPTWCPAKYNGDGSLKCEMDKRGELKGLVAGTTSIVGLPGTSAACFASLSRSIDVSQNGLGPGEDHVQSSTLFPPSKSSADGVCKNFSDGDTTAYLIHCGEGTDAKSLNEFMTLGTVSTTQSCLYAPQTVITHGTAFTPTEFAIMGSNAMKLTWSPASNVALYGATTNIPAALDAHVLVALGPDWSMGGSQNMLDELRFADAWDNDHWNNRLSTKDLVTMATLNGAKALALDHKLGEIQEGMLADLFVVDGDPAHPYDAIVAATPREVVLTMVGGKILYGDAALKSAGPTNPGCEDLQICGRSKFLCAATPDTTNKLNQTYSQIKAALETGLTDSDTALSTDPWSFAPLAPLVACP